jgi:hypothetical protein
MNNEKKKYLREVKRMRGEGNDDDDDENEWGV